MTAKTNPGNRCQKQKRLNLTVKLLRNLFKNVRPFDISSNHRKETNTTTDLSLTYGEINVESFLQLLALIEKEFAKIAENDTTNDNTSKVFVDLGSGTGRAVFCAALSPYNYTKAWGIEIVPVLSAEAFIARDNLASILSMDNSNNSTTATSNVTNGTNSTVMSTPFKIEPKPKKSVDVTQVIVHIIEKYATLDASTTVPVETLANKLTIALGHKQYKAHVKQHKSFLRYLKSLPEKFILSNEDQNIGMCVNNTNNITDSHNENMAAAVNYANDSNSNNDDTGTETEEFMGNNEAQEALPSTSPLATEAAVMVTTANSSNNENTSDTIPANPNVVFQMQNTLTSSEKSLFQPLAEIIFETGSIFDVPWYDTADVVYTASLLFSNEMMCQLTQQVSLMKKNTFFITLKPLVLDLDPSYPDKIHLISESFFKMSWQMAKVYIYRID